MPRFQPLPQLWLLSDARNDAALEAALKAMPRGSGFVFRHYHLPGPQRLARFRALARVARARGALVVLADSAQTAREWGADGVYGAPLALWPRRAGLIQLATAHSLRELAQAARKGVHGVLVSPVFATRSHPGAGTLGPVRWRLLAHRATVPVIALGGMTPRTARRLQWQSWAAIDGLS